MPSREQRGPFFEEPASPDSEPEAPARSTDPPGSTGELDPDLRYVRGRLRRLVDGDARRAEALRRLLWAAYCEAGCPYGADEAGLYRWLAF